MIVIEYPTNARGDPARISAARLYSVAASVRRQGWGVPVRPLPVEAIAARTGTIVVNGRRLRLVWKLADDVHDEGARSVLGACIHDPAEPGTVEVRLNGPLLSDRPEVLRSTAVHELAHAIFDMPAMIGRATFARRTDAKPAVPMVRTDDWPEWRANEFMGAFLVPTDRLAKSIVRQAGALRVPVRWCGENSGLPRPVIDVRPNHPALGPMVDALAEEFGVSCTFMETRLRKGYFVGGQRTLERAR